MICTSFDPGGRVPATKSAASSTVSFEQEPGLMQLPLRELVSHGIDPPGWHILGTSPGALHNPSMSSLWWHGPSASRSNCIVQVYPPVLGFTGLRTTLTSPTLGNASSFSSIEDPSPPLSSVVANALCSIKLVQESNSTLMTLFGLKLESKQSFKYPPNGSVPATNSFTWHPFVGMAPFVVHRPASMQSIRGTLPTFLPQALLNPESQIAVRETPGPNQFPGK
mmetsp:Transcript_21665/g.63661  ORF Transcript_21665/g.63661 Transcript_21665/m.63661 type:complete len:223 (-) Transcript_21665:1101-1769(-)